MPRRKIKWAAGDVFGVPLIDERIGVGQVLDLMMPNVVRCAFYSEVLSSMDRIDLREVTLTQNLIALLACSREQLDYGVWKILGNKVVSTPVNEFPNEQYRHKGWVGAKHYDAAIAESFLNCFHALAPWDDWFDPQYLDQLLVDPIKKPSKLILTKS